MRMTMLRLASIWIIAALTASTATAADYEGLLVEPAKTLQRHDLIDHDGQVRAFPVKNGKPQLVFFGFSHCPDVCPTALQKVAAVLKNLGDDAARLETVFITIDPERDRPANLKTFVARFHPTLTGLTGTPENIKKVENDFGVLTRKVKGKAALAYNMDHSVFVYLLNTAGQVRLMYPASAQPAAITKDIQRLLREGAG